MNRATLSRTFPKSIKTNLNKQSQLKKQIEIYLNKYISICFDLTFAVSMIIIICNKFSIHKMIYFSNRHHAYYQL